MNRLITTTAALIAASGFAAATQAATIVYAFDGESAAATTNEFSGDGVTAGNISIANGGGGGWQIGSTEIDELDVISMKLGGTANAAFSFTLDIGSTATDLTGLSFAFDYESNNGSGADYYAGWTLAISTGSASASSGSVGPYAPGIGTETTTENLTLSGLTGLSNTSVTFTFTADNGVTDTFANGNANNRRTIFDDITLTGSVVPEPGSLALLGLGGLLIGARRRR